MNRLFGVSLVVMWLTGGALAQSVRFDQLPVKTSLARTAAPLKIEPVGIAPGRAWAKPLADPFEVDGQWRHVFYFKKAGKSERISHPATLNLTTGEIKQHPPVPGLETWKTQWLGGKLYLGQNIPANIIVYDPAADTFTDLGHAFNEAATVFRMAVTHDGKLALAGNHPAELSVYDPQTGQFRKYGKISEVNTYCYELGVGGDYIYGSTRGKAPWELIAVHRTTGERTLITTRPTDGYINISGNRVGVRNSSSDPFEPLVLEGTTLKPYVPPATASATPGTPQPAKPQVYHDASTVYESHGLYTIHYQSSPGDTTWRKATMTMPLGSESLVEAVSLSDGRILAAAGAYVPVVVFDPKTGEGTQVPLGELSIRSALLLKDKLYLTGYPGANVYMLDLNKPVTSTQATPLAPAVASTDAKANPRQIATFPMTTRSGGHIGVGLFPGPAEATDGKIYLCTRRHRHHRGFSIAWFIPPADAKAKPQYGSVDTGNAFDHLQIGGISQSIDGSKLLISTYVEPNDQIEGSAPPSAKLFVLDLKSEKITGTFTPVEDSRCLTGIVEASPGIAVGLALNNAKTHTVIYRMDLKSGKVLQADQYASVLQSLPGVTGIPVKGPGFVMGPDGMIWTSVGVAAGQSILVRIDPESLAIRPVGLDMTNGCAMLFHEGELYLTGGSRMRRVVLPESIRLSRSN